MFYIGAIIGGPELSNSPVETVLVRLPSDDTIDSGTSLDIVFHVPGSAFTPEFEGVRTGRLSRKEGILQVQIAVPSSVVHKPANEIREFAFGGLRHAIQLASNKLAKARVPFNEKVLTDLVERMEAEYRS
jgi:hypothetical protein